MNGTRDGWRVVGRGSPSSADDILLGWISCVFRLDSLFRNESSTSRKLSDEDKIVGRE